MNPPGLQDVLADIGRLPSLPAVVADLIRALDDDNVGVDRLADGIAKDQALAARVLRVANSPFFGVPHKVASIHDAIVVLGFRAVSSLVTAASMTSLFVPAAWTGFDLACFWRHGIGAAVCARALARRAGLDGEGAFTAGLMHDIGQLMLVTMQPALYAQALAWRDANDCPMHEAERRVLGFDHAQVGAALTEHWHLPPDIVRAIALHHAPESGAERSLADVVHVANILANALDLADDPRALVAPLDAGAWQRLGLTASALKAMLGAIEHEHESHGALLAP